MALGSLYSGLGIALYQLRDVKENYVSKTDLQVSDLSTPQGVTAEQIKELTDQLKLTSQEVEALRQIEEKHTEELQRQNDALLKQEGRR
jgi:TolA-binding protein